MNTNPDNNPLHDHRFDRLVDGELSEKERREMLAGLDDEPGGWRRCALAFLESQCWKQTLGAFPQPTVRNEVSATPTHSTRSRWHNRTGTLLAMAASFFVLFWVGSLVRQATTDRVAAPTTGIGELAKTVSTDRTPVQSKQADYGSATQPWHMVTVSQPASAQAAGHSLRVPAVERNNLDQQWAQNLPPAVPDNVMRAFQRTGHRVQQRRELVPVPLEDGRHLVVPVDQVDVHYVGDKTY